MKLRDLLDRVWSTFSPVGNIHSQADIMNIEPTPSRADQRAPMVARHSLPDQRAPLPSSTQRLACHSAPLAKLSQTWAHALERVSPALALERPSRSWVLGGKLLCAPDQTAWPHEGERAVAISMALARRCAVGRQLLEMQQTTLEEQSAQRHRAPSGTERTTESSPNEQQERQSFGCVDVPAEQGQALIVPAVPGIVSTHGLRLLEEWAAAQEALGRAESRDTASGTAPTYSQHVQGGAYPVMPSQTASSNCDTAAGTGAGSAAAVGVEWWTAFLGARGQLLPAAACAADFLGCSAFTAAFTALQLLRLAAALEALSGGGYGGGGRGRATADAREVAELLPPFAFLGKVWRGWITRSCLAPRVAQVQQKVSCSGMVCSCAAACQRKQLQRRRGGVQAKGCLFSEGLWLGPPQGASDPTCRALSCTTARAVQLQDFHGRPSLAGPFPTAAQLRTGVSNRSNAVGCTCNGRGATVCGSAAPGNN